MEFEALALSSRFEKGRKSGLLTISEFSLVFTFDNEKITLPLNGINSSFGGAGNRLVYFSHPTVPDVTISCGDTKILSHPYLKKEVGAAPAIQKIDSHRKALVLYAAITLTIVGLAIAALVYFRGSIVKQIASGVPVEWEKTAGDKMFLSIKETSGLIEDSALLVDVRKLCNELTPAVKDTAFKFNFYIANDETLNAYALPGGNVVIHSGLLLKAESPEEILGVIGHEIAHVTQRHHARGLIDKLGISLIVMTFIGDGTGLSDLIINTGGNLTALQGSRDFERESDEKGWEYLLDRNINPVGMINFFKKLEEENKVASEASEAMNFMSTHPATSERVETLEKKYKTLADKSSFKKLNFDLKDFQNRLKEKTK